MDSTSRLISRNKAISWDLLPNTLLNSAPFREIARAAINSEEFRSHTVPDHLYQTRAVALVKDPTAPKIRDNIVVCLSQEVIKYKLIENITSKFIYTPREEKCVSVKTYVASIHNLVIMLHNVGLLREIVEELEIEFFQKMKHILSNPKLSQLQQSLGKLIDLESLLECSQQKEAFLFALLMPKESVFHINKLAYSQLNENIYEHFQLIKQNIQNKLGITQIQFVFNQNKGYQFCLRLERDISTDQIQDVLDHKINQVDHKGKVFKFMTQHLVSLNQRLIQKYDDLVMSCCGEIFQIIQIVQESIEVLFNVNSVVSELDMIMSFHRIIENTKMFMSKPVFTDEFKCLLFNDMLNLHTTIHPQKPNQVFSCELNKMTIILGSAATGKTAYLKAIGINVILAHIGCYVPAQLAVLSPISLLLTKFQIHDNLEKNESSLEVELKTLDNIEKNLRRNREETNILVIVDNLITCSSHQQNLAMNMFYLESLLLNLNGFVFASTNDTKIIKFKSLYKQVYFLYANSHYQFEKIFQKSDDFKNILVKCGFQRYFIDNYDHNLKLLDQQANHQSVDQRFIENCLEKTILMFKDTIQINAQIRDHKKLQQAKKEIVTKYSLQ